jgi:hypothetical protein
MNIIIIYIAFYLIFWNNIYFLFLKSNIINNGPRNSRSGVILFRDHLD